MKPLLFLFFVSLASPAAALTGLVAFSANSSGGNTGLGWNTLGNPPGSSDLLWNLYVTQANSGLNGSTGLTQLDRVQAFNNVPSGGRLDDRGFITLEVTGPSAVPEPATAGLVCGAGLVWFLRRRAAGLLAVVAVLGVAANAAPLYTIIGLGQAAAGSQFTPYGLNAAGVVVGTLYQPNLSGLNSAYQWSGGVFTSVPVLAGTQFSYGRAINDSGQITGWGRIEHAYRTTVAGPAQDLGTLGSSTSYGYDINNAGQAVGWSAVNNVSPAVAFRATGLSMTSLGTLGGTSSAAYGINNLGHVTGTSQTATNESRAFVWNGTTMTALPTLSGDPNGNTGFGINDAGEVVGISNAAGGFIRAVVWNGSGIHDLGTLGAPYSVGIRINSAGWAVGYSTNSSTGVGGGDGLAFVWDGTTTFDLNTVVTNGSGWVLRVANDINDSGQIVGWGHRNGVQEAFLLTPVSTVPEPSTLTIMALTGVIWAGRSLTRRRLHQ